MAVILRESGVSSTRGSSIEFLHASGILDRPLSRAMTPRKIVGDRVG
jgi:hypothetical protein